MMYPIDSTHDASRRSWIESANDERSDFPLQNLPWCVADLNAGQGAVHPAIGVRIGDSFLALRSVALSGALSGALSTIPDEALPELFSGSTLSRELLGLPVEDRLALRSRLIDLLSTEATSETRELLTSHLSPARHFLRPMHVGDYSDFYASVHHATNVGTMFRPINPLLPNYKWIPVGYHGRASSVVVSGAEVRRPIGQLAPSAEGEPPRFGPCQLLDYELEMGAIIGRENSMGDPVSLDEAESHLFGLCLLNDWSARDLQKWEYQPLGPFLAKNFATSISPFIVSPEALAPFRVSAEERPSDDPQPLPHLDGTQNRQRGGFDVRLEVYLRSEQMRLEGVEAMKLSEGSFKAMYWTVAQMITHHSASGCNLQPGDLLGSGTVSGPDRGQRGCLLELTWDGSKDNPLPGSQRTPLILPTGETRKFLADGDEIILKGYCVAEGYRRIGFGACSGVILPAHQG